MLEMTFFWGGEGYKIQTENILIHLSIVHK